MSNFALDSNGEISTKPLTGWNLGHIGGVAILLEAHYADTPEELETEYRHTLCLSLSLPLALELAEALRRNAEGLMNQTSPADTLLH